MGFRVWGLGLEVLGFYRAQGLEGLVLESGRNRLLYGFSHEFIGLLILYGLSTTRAALNPKPLNLKPLNP